MSDIPSMVISQNPNTDNVLSSCPLVLANDPDYLANDDRACAGSGISHSAAPRVTIDVPTISVR